MENATSEVDWMFVVRSASVVEFRPDPHEILKATEAVQETFLVAAPGDLWIHLHSDHTLNFSFPDQVKVSTFNLLGSRVSIDVHSGVVVGQPFTSFSASSVESRRVDLINWVTEELGLVLDLDFPSGQLPVLVVIINRRGVSIYAILKDGAK